MNTRRLKACMVAVLLAAALPALADTVVDETREAAPDGTVTVELIAGSLVIEGWDQAEVHIAGTLGEGVEKLDIDSSGRRTSIEVEPRGGRFRDGGADLKLQVPAASDVEIEAVSAPIEIRGVRGEISVEAVNGDVTITGSVAEVEVETVNGKLVFESDVPLVRASFEAVSGSIELSASVDRSGRLSAEAVSGDVRLTLPSDTCAEFELSTFSGNIESDSEGTVEKSEFLPAAKSMEFSTGSCRARIDVSSFSGHIVMRKR